MLQFILNYVVREVLDIFRLLGVGGRRYQARTPGNCSRSFCIIEALTLLYLLFSLGLLHLLHLEIVVKAIVSAHFEPRSRLSRLYHRWHLPLYCVVHHLLVLRRPRIVRVLSRGPQSIGEVVGTLHVLTQSEIKLLVFTYATLVADDSRTLLLNDEHLVIFLGGLLLPGAAGCCHFLRIVALVC